MGDRMKLSHISVKTLCISTLAGMTITMTAATVLALYFFGQQEYSGCRRHPYAVCNAVEFPADYPVSNASDRVCDSIMRCDRPYDVR